MNVAEKIESKTIKTSCGCWLFLGSCNDDGYGRLILDGKQQLTHRLSYELANGPIPEGLCVLHKCDVPCCCNPKHLFLGTHADNMRDASAKKRLTRTTIAKEKIEFIKENSHVPLRTLAATLGVGATTVHRYKKEHAC